MSSVPPIAGSATAFPRKIEWLDGLRGTAAFAVLLAHIRNLVLPDVLFAQYVPYGRLIESSPLMITMASDVAVRVFFIHSGFVLSWKYLNHPDLRILVSMCLRRVFRLSIPITAAILFAFALMRLNLMHNAETAALTHTGAPLVAHYWFQPTLSSLISDVFGGWFVHESVRYDGALWTMPIELVCSYIVFLILPVVVLLRSPWFTLALLVVSFAMIGSYPWLAYFFVGILFVQLYRASRPLSALPAWLILALAIALGVGAPRWAPLLPHGSAATAREIGQLFASLLLVAVLFARPQWQRILERPLMQFLGRTSFSVYLLHIPILCSLSSVVFIELHRLRCPHLANAAVTAAVTIVAAYALSWVMWRYIDRFAINFGKATLERYLYRRDSGFTTDRPVEGAPTTIGVAFP